MSNFKESQQWASRGRSGLIIHGQFEPSQFGAVPTPANTGLETMMRARMSMQKRQQEADAKQHLRQLERESKVNRFANAERVMVGKPPIRPRMKPFVSGPTSLGVLQTNSIFSLQNLDFQDSRYTSATIEFIFNHVGGWGNYYGVDKFGTNSKVGKQGIYQPNARGRRIDTTPPDAAMYNIYVNPKGQFNFNDVNFSDRNLINYLFGNMLSGQGPENYVFPTDGFVSKRAAEGATFKGAINQWYKMNERAIREHNTKKIEGHEFKVDYGLFSQVEDLTRDGTLFTIPNFIGSAWATVELLGNNRIKITIFNISNITSGDLEKHLPQNKWSKSIQRKPNQPTPFGNISTTFSVTQQIDYAYFSSQDARDASLK